EAHGSSRNRHMTPINENSFFLSMEQNMDGNWIKVKNRITTLPPVGLTIEVLEGPMAGSKMINVYTAKGKKTGIDVYGEFTSSQVPENQLEHTVKGFLGAMFDEDSLGIKEFAGKP
ncbi:MAG: hypothetical protein WA761_04745, partial [Thermoplasmata archaeon]